MNNLHFNTRQLFAFSLLAVVHGGGFLFGWIGLGAGQKALPVWLFDIYSLAWLLAGLWGILCATVLRHHSKRRTARPFLAAAFVVWSSVYIVGWIALGSPTAWFGAALYLLIAWAIADPPSPWGMRRGFYWRSKGGG